MRVLQGLLTKELGNGSQLAMRSAAAMFLTIEESLLYSLKQALCRLSLSLLGSLSMMRLTAKQRFLGEAEMLSAGTIGCLETGRVRC